ncbi:MAG: phenylalanine--tRNA ligase subunit alpha [Fibrobacteria bacterium]|nr:phenylalanine--tRNA ligase subunit alpha [Fibrobacteria bacterium]
MTPLDEVRSAWASLAPTLNAADESTLVELRSRFVGKKGEIPGLMRHLGSLPPEEKPAYGSAVQALRQEVEGTLDRLQVELRSRALAQRLESERLDLSLDGDGADAGTLHPLLALRDEILDLFTGMGFDVADAPEIDTEWFNFSALNVPDDHPARDMQDTFFLSREPGQEAVVLRTHTSNYQIHALRDRKPPFRLLHCGQVYRCDADATHAPMFCQVEGLVLDRGITFANLKATLFTMVRALYGPQAVLRFRPSFFPFTEPSAEMDVDCRSVGLDRDGWMEIGGCGMVHPKVLENGGLDASEFQGFAFGFGLDRMAMLRHGIKEIALLTNGDMRFLRQFRGLA